MVWELKCKHVFHKNCIKPISWIERRRKKRLRRQTPPRNNIVIRETIQPRHLVIDPGTSIEPYIHYINNLPFSSKEVWAKAHFSFK